MKFFRIFSKDEGSLYSKLSLSDRKRIIKFAIDKANKEQLDVVRKYGRRYGVKKAHESAVN